MHTTQRGISLGLFVWHVGQDNSLKCPWLMGPWCISQMTFDYSVPPLPKMSNNPLSLMVHIWQIRVQLEVMGLTV